MYATIPEDEAKQPKHQAPVRGSYGLVVAVCVGVIIGTLGTIAFIGGPEAPSPSRAAMELDAQSDCRPDDPLNPTGFCKEWIPGECKGYKPDVCAVMECVSAVSH